MDVLQLASAHIVRAALHAAGLLDQTGSTSSSAHHGYVRYPTGGIYPPDDLRRGEELLVRCGLVSLEDDRLVPTAELLILLHGSDGAGAELLIRRVIETAQHDAGGVDEMTLDAFLSEHIADPVKRALVLESVLKYDPAIAAEVGAAGEEAVVSAAQAELRELGRPDLADTVQRISLVTDSVGYDVLAPRLEGAARHLEVKTSARIARGLATFFLSRQEAEVGQYDSTWALVVCTYKDGQADVLGWCRGPSLVPYLPIDTGGRWTAVQIDIPLTMLRPGIPEAL